MCTLNSSTIYSASWDAWQCPEKPSTFFDSSTSFNGGLLLSKFQLSYLFIGLHGSNTVYLRKHLFHKS